MDKKVKITKLENSQARMAITVPAKDVEKAYTELLNKYAKEVQIKGFRKGKAPVHILEQKYGEAIAMENADRIIESVAQEAVSEAKEKDQPLPYSTITHDPDLKVERGKDLNFSFVYDVMPVVKLDKYTDLTVKVEDSSVSKKEVDAEIERLREQNALVVEKKSGKIEDKDIVTCSFYEVDKDKNIVEGTQRNNFVFTVGSNANFYDLDDKVKGMKKGDEKTFKLSYDKDNAPSQDYIGKKINLFVKIDEIKVKDLPKLDNEFAQDISSEYKTLKDLESNTKKKLNEKLEQVRENKRLEVILDEILKKVKIDVPVSMINMELENNWKNTIRQSGLQEDQMLQFLKMQGQTKQEFMKNWEPDVITHLNRQLVLDAIVKQEKFKADSKKLKERVEKELAQIKDEGTLNYYKSLIEDEMKMQKAIDFILEKNTFKVEKKVPYQEFITR